MKITPTNILDYINNYNKNIFKNQIIMLEHKGRYFIENYSFENFDKIKNKIPAIFENKYKTQINIPTKLDFEKNTDLPVSLSNNLNMDLDFNTNINLFNNKLKDAEKYSELFNNINKSIQQQDLKILNNHLNKCHYNDVFLNMDLDFNTNNENKGILEQLKSLNNIQKYQLVNNFIEDYDKQKEKEEQKKLALIRENWRGFKNMFLTNSEIGLTKAARINQEYLLANDKFKEKILNELLRYQGGMVQFNEMKDYLESCNLNYDLTNKFVDEYTKNVVTIFFGEFEENINNLLDKKYFKPFGYVEENFKLMISTNLGNELINNIIKNIDYNQIKRIKPNITNDFEKELLKIRLNLCDAKEKELIQKDLKIKNITQINNKDKEIEI